MQEERSTLNSFSETIDLNQGSFPINTSMNYSHSRDNTVNLVENRFSNYILESSVDNICANSANTHAPSFSTWDHGESSSSTNNLKDQFCRDDSNMRLGLLSSFIDGSSTDAKSENRYGCADNQVDGRFPSVLNYGSNCGPLNVSLHNRLVRESNSHIGLGANQSGARFMVGTPETEQLPTLYGSSSDTGSSLGWSSTMLENNDASGPASGPLFGTWGSSCKRKALDGISRQLYSVGSSSSKQPMENILQRPITGCYASPSDLGVSSGAVNLCPINNTEQLNSRTEIGTNRVSPNVLPSSIPRIAQSSTANFSVRSNLEHLESVPFGTPRGSSVRHSSVHDVQQLSQPVLNSKASELRSPSTVPINPTSLPNHSHSMHLNEAQGMLSRGGSSSNSIMISGERGSRAPEVDNVGNSSRNNPECSMIVPAPETRNVIQNQIDWSFSPGTLTSSRNYSTGSPAGPSSDGQTYSRAQLPYQNDTSQNHQRLLEVAPWIPLPGFESNSATRGNRISYLPLPPSSSSEVVTTSRTQQQLEAAFLTDMPSDNINGSRALAYVEGRQRLICQVLNAMQSGVHMHAEDFVLRHAELTDRHRDMRLDVDNMSYEELLALEERIGNVSAGLNEEKILASMKQRVFEPTGAKLHIEPCCICQEDYNVEDDIGILDCGHEFHTNCIKQWLVLKNLCPICKMTALGT